MTGRSLMLQTPLGSAALLVAGLRGHEAVSELFSFQLELLTSHAADIPFDKLLGQPATVTLTLPGQSPRFFSGIISRLEEGDAIDDFVRFEADLVPAFWLWTKRIQSRVFQQQSVPDILHTVLRGLDATFELTGTYPARDYCVQYRETDFAFASRLMEEEGIYYYFRHTSDGHTLVLADLPAGNERVTPVAYQTVGGSERAPGVWSWRKAQVITASKWAVRDYNFELSNHQLEATAELSEEAAAGSARHRLRGGFNEQFDVFESIGGHGRHADDVSLEGHDRPRELARLFDEAQVQARIRMQEAASNALEVRGHGDCGWFLPGAHFELTRHRHADGKYFLTRVEHEAKQRGFRSGEEPGAEYQNNFRCIPGGIHYRPPRITPRPTVPGTQTATVVGPSDRDTYVDRHGRVKVQFHWDRLGRKDARSSCWVRVTQAWAGKGWGAFFWPRIGHEVVVAFEEGNPDRPIIVGSVYNDQNPPPHTLPDQRVVSGFRTRSHESDDPQHYNEIRMEDVPSQELLHIQAQRDMNTAVEYDYSLKVDHNSTVTVNNDATTSVGSGLTSMNMLNTWNNIEIDKLTKSTVVGAIHDETNGTKIEVSALKLETVGVMRVQLSTLSAVDWTGLHRVEVVGSALLPTAATKSETVWGDKTVAVSGHHKVLNRQFAMETTSHHGARCETMKLECAAEGGRTTYLRMSSMDTGKEKLSRIELTPNVVDINADPASGVVTIAARQIVLRAPGGLAIQTDNFSVESYQGMITQRMKALKAAGADEEDLLSQLEVLGLPQNEIEAIVSESFPPEDLT